MPRVEFAGKLLDAHAVALECYEQMVHEIGRLVANVVVVAVLCRHDDLGSLLGKLLEQAVLFTSEKTRRIALLGRGIAPAMYGCGETADGLTDIARLHVSRALPNIRLLISRVPCALIALRLDAKLVEKAAAGARMARGARRVHLYEQHHLLL